MTKSNPHATGVALVVLAGVIAGGAWSFFTRKPRTQPFLIAALVLALVAAALFFSGFTRLG